MSKSINVTPASISLCKSLLNISHRIPLAIYIVCLFLAVHVFLLAYIATQKSPTFLEPAFLVSGLSHWESGHYELYRVNPPLVRMVAALPVLLEEHRMEFIREKYFSINSRAEYWAGYEFIKHNGERSIWLITLARFACIPFSIIGGIVCYRWANELYGQVAGLLACGTWSFSPNILGHGSLITTDAHAAAIGILAAYLFWRWIISPTLIRTLLAGVALGLALLTKFTLCVFIPIWLIVWLLRCITIRSPNRSFRSIFFECCLLSGIFIISTHILCLGYNYEDVPTRISELSFKSDFLSKLCTSSDTTQAKSSVLANQFISVISKLVIPVPRDYIIGIDLQIYDFETSGDPSYIRGQFSNQGWWYYYLYGVLVKTPIGTLVLLSWATISRLFVFCRPSAQKKMDSTRLNRSWGEFIIILSFFSIFILVSSETSFSKHLRYILPCYPFMFIWFSQTAQSKDIQKNKRIALLKMVTVGAVFTFSTISSILTLPHSISYFNLFTGGIDNGPRHFIGSNIDWGQDLLEVKKWQSKDDNRKGIYLAYYGSLDPRDLGITCNPLTSKMLRKPLKPGIYVISASLLQGMPWFSIADQNGIVEKYNLHDFRNFKMILPKYRLGGSFLVFEIKGKMEAPE
tara:strand:+ start:8869 stop:10761 length:1893 start_codon:yes stop_codon:yes gene_type:complete